MLKCRSCTGHIKLLRTKRLIFLRFNVRLDIRIKLNLQVYGIMVFLLQSGRWEKSSCVYFTCIFLLIQLQLYLFDICSLLLNKKKSLQWYLYIRPTQPLILFLGLLHFLSLEKKIDHYVSDAPRKNLG